MINLEESAPSSCPFAQIIDAVRAELLEYGSLLNLFDEQQAAILDLNRKRLNEIARETKGQISVLSARNSQFASRVSALRPQRTARPSLLQICPLFPEPMRPLVEALASELNSLSERVQRRRWQLQTMEERMLGTPRTAEANPPAFNAQQSLAA